MYVQSTSSATEFTATADGTFEDDASSERRMPTLMVRSGGSKHRVVGYNFLQKMAMPKDNHCIDPAPANLPPAWHQAAPARGTPSGTTDYHTNF